MSHRLEKRAWAAELPMIDKFVLIYLARVVKEHDGSNLYASMKGIAKAIGACPRAVQNAMYRLAAAGYLEITVKANRPGGMRSNVYRLIIDRLPVLDEPTHEMRGSDNVIHLEPTHDMRGTHAPDAQNLDSIKEEEAAADARAPLPAYALVWQAFNDARAMVLGEEFRLPCPAGSDRCHAEQFLAQGVTVQECAAIFVEKIERANRAKPPGTLAYFQKPIAEFVADRKAPSKDRRHDQQYHPASGKSGRGGSVVSSETWRGCLADFVLEQSGLDDSRTAAGGLP